MIAQITHTPYENCHRLISNAKFNELMAQLGTLVVHSGETIVVTYKANEVTVVRRRNNSVTQFIPLSVGRNEKHG